MSQQVQGTVDRVYDKAWQDKTLYSFKLVGDSQYYRVGTRQPNFSNGDNVTFQVEWKGNNANVDFKSIKVGGSAPAPSQSSSGGGGGKSAGSRDDYWAKKEAYDKEVTQPRITYASAQHDATAIVCAALAHDAIGFGNAKKSDRLEIIVGYVKETTALLVTDMMNAPDLIEAAVKNNSLPNTEGVVHAQEDSSDDGWE